MLTCCLGQRFAPLFVSGPSCFGLADLANCCGDKVKAANQPEGSAQFHSVTTAGVPEEVLGENSNPEQSFPQRGLKPHHTLGAEVKATSAFS